MENKALPQCMVWGRSPQKLKKMLNYCTSFNVNGGNGVNVHAYADDTQLYLHFRRSDATVSTDCLEDCVADIGDWMSANRLKLDMDKTSKPSGCWPAPDKLYHCWATFIQNWSWGRGHDYCCSRLSEPAWSGHRVYSLNPNATEAAFRRLLKTFLFARY